MNRLATIVTGDELREIITNWLEADVKTAFSRVAIDLPDDDLRSGKTVSVELHPGWGR